MAIPNFEDFDPDFAGPAQWAAMYRHYGLQVIPCFSPSEVKPGTAWKRPLLSTWTTLQEELVPDAAFERWYDQTNGEHRHRRNMGIISGACSGRVFVLDLDLHKKPEALAWWNSVCHLHNHGLDLETPRQRTGGGGQQLLFRAPEGWVAPTNRTDRGVDVRGQGGFAVMPASLHDSGGSYDWLPGQAPWEVAIAEAPPWLLEEIDKLVGASVNPTHSNQSQPQPERPGSGGDYDAFGNRIDGRETAMRDMVWRCVVQLRRLSPIKPIGRQAQELVESEYEVYERTVQVQNPLPGESKRDGLNRENRGPVMFADKWAYAMAQWDTDVARAAAEPDPHPEADFKAPPEQPKVDPATGQPLPLLLTAEQFVAGFTPPSYLIDGIVQRGYLYSLTARTNHGKTAVAMYVAQAVARGEAMHGRRTRPGTVLLLAGENPDDIRARFLVLAQAYGFEPEQLKMRFVAGVISLVTRMAEIRAEAETIDNLVLVIVDTAAAYFPGDETNSNSQQGAYARILRELTNLRGKPAVLVNCHPVKNASRENLLPMGGSAFVNEVDGNLTLWASNEGQTSLHWQGKFRGPEFEPLSFELTVASSERVKDAEGRLMPSVVAKPISEVTMEASETVQENDEDRILLLIHKNPKASFLELATKAGFVVDGKPQKWRVQRIIARLKDDKLVEKRRGTKYQLTAKGRREAGVSGDDD